MIFRFHCNTLRALLFVILFMSASYYATFIIMSLRRLLFHEMYFLWRVIWNFSRDICCCTTIPLWTVKCITFKCIVFASNKLALLLLFLKISFHSIENAVRSVSLDYKAKVSRRAQSVLSKYTYAVARIYLQTFAIHSPKPLLSRAISFDVD